MVVWKEPNVKRSISFVREAKGGRRECTSVKCLCFNFNSSQFPIPIMFLTNVRKRRHLFERTAVQIVRSHGLGVVRGCPACFCVILLLFSTPPPYGFIAKNISDYSLIDTSCHGELSDHQIIMRGMRKFSQSESVWEVGTAVSSLESGYHSASWSVSGHTQHQLQHEEEVGASPGWPDRSQCWSDHLYTKVKEAGDTGDTKLDLLDSLILEDVKERLQEGKVSGSSRAVLGSLGSLVRGSELSSQSQLYLDIFIQHNIPLAFPGQVQPVSLLPSLVLVRKYYRCSCFRSATTTTIQVRFGWSTASWSRTSHSLSQDSSSLRDHG